MEKKGGRGAVLAPALALPLRGRAWARPHFDACGDTQVQLGALYRADHLTSQGCCGLTPVHSRSVENFDATPQVAADSDSYHFALPAVLEAAGLFPTGS